MMIARGHHAWRYDVGFESALQDRPCPNESCGCHIGYVHLDHLELDRVFGNGVLERIPTANRHSSSSN